MNSQIYPHSITTKYTDKRYIEKIIATSGYGQGPPSNHHLSHSNIIFESSNTIGSRWQGVAPMHPCNFNSNLVLGQSERGVGLGWNWEKLTLNAIQLAGQRMDEKFERVGSLKMCVREGKWRNVEEERR